MKIFVGSILLVFVSYVSCHSYHLGSCPVVEPMQGFNMEKFLGEWYVMQKTSTASSCLVYNFTHSDEPGEYSLIQSSQHFALGLTPLDHEYTYTGRLNTPDSAVPGRMVVKFPLSVAGTASYSVLMTDYDTHAAVFTCQKLAFAHRQSATLLSRRKTLDKAYIDKMRTRLAAFNIDPFELSIISQKDCPKTGTDHKVDINIDDDTFSAKSVAGVVRKAGEKIGDGIEYVVSGAKKVYDKVGNDREGKREPLMTPNSSDNEWLP